MSNYNTEDNIIQVIGTLYKDSSRALLLNRHLSNFFRTAVGVSQGSLLSPVLFNIYLENIVQETLNDFQTSISNNIDLPWGTAAEL